MKFIDRITCNWIPSTWFKSVGYSLVRVFCALSRNCLSFRVQGYTYVTCFEVKYVTSTCNNPSLTVRFDQSKMIMELNVGSLRAPSTLGVCQMLYWYATPGAHLDKGWDQKEFIIIHYRWM